MFKTAYMAVRGQIVGLFVRRQEPVMLSALGRFAEGVGVKGFAVEL